MNYEPADFANRIFYFASLSVVKRIYFREIVQKVCSEVLDLISSYARYVGYKRFKIVTRFLYPPRLGIHKPIHGLTQ